MTLFHPHQKADAIAFANAGGQALYLVAITPGRLYDRDCARLVATARELGQVAVYVAHTGTEHQHVVLSHMPLVKACMAARTLSNVILVDMLAPRDGADAYRPASRQERHTAAQPQAVAS